MKLSNLSEVMELDERREMLVRVLKALKARPRVTVEIRDCDKEIIDPEDGQAVHEALTAHFRETLQAVEADLRAAGVEIDEAAP